MQYSCNSTAKQSIIHADLYASIAPYYNIQYFKLVSTVAERACNSALFLSRIAVVKLEAYIPQSQTAYSKDCNKQAVMEHLFSPCTRYRDTSETQSRPGPDPPEWLRGLKLDVSTKELLGSSADTDTRRGALFTYADSIQFSFIYVFHICEYLGKHLSGS
jgi:hypothetical protein